MDNHNGLIIYYAYILVVNTTTKITKSKIEGTAAICMFWNPCTHSSINRNTQIRRPHQSLDIWNLPMSIRSHIFPVIEMDIDRVSELVLVLVLVSESARVVESRML